MAKITSLCRDWLGSFTVSKRVNYLSSIEGKGDLKDISNELHKMPLYSLIYYKIAFLDTYQIIPSILSYKQLEI